MINEIVNPTLVDAVIAKIQDGLKAKISWLDYAFGRAERIVKQFDGKNIRIPAIYTGNERQPNEYLELSPDANIGNFSFFWLMDPQKYTWRPGMPGGFKVPFALIFWFDLREIYSETDNRNVSAIEAEIIHTLNGGFLIPNGSIRIDTIYTLAENIYKEFSLEAVDNQFLMHPYAGIRFEGSLIFDEPCFEL